MDGLIALWLFGSFVKGETTPIIARLSLRAPRDYADVFRILGEAVVLPQELADQMQNMARLSNLLVHIHWTIDH